MIQFLLNLEPVQRPDSESTRTVLDYLRNDALRMGTKEGCGSGDCGACTVAVAEIVNGRLVYSSLNSCITLLGSLQGKQLITVEDLSDDALHPVQQAMVDHHGSQCGFCTPGFVMSLFVMYKQMPRDTSRQAVVEGLSGNLCRCTGYRPIVDAGLACLADQGMDGFVASEPAVIRALGSIAKSTGPSTVAELAEKYCANPDARLVAGSTDLGLEVTQELYRPDNVLFVRQIDALTAIIEEEDGLVIGGAASLSSIEIVARKHFPALADLLTRFGSPQIRSQATIGGNLATASPIGDLPPVLLVIDATLQLRCGDQTRKVPIEDFFTGYRKTVLVQSEFVESIHVPFLTDRQVLRVYKVSKRMDDDISAICLAIRMTMNAPMRSGEYPRGLVSDIRIGAGGMAATPVRGRECEEAFHQRAFDLTTVQSAQQALTNDFSPISDVRASARYRLLVARNLLLRFYHELNGSLPEVTIGQVG